MSILAFIEPNLYPSGVETTATYLKIKKGKKIFATLYWIPFILRKQHINDDIELIIIREMCYTDTTSLHHDYLNDGKKEQDTNKMVQTTPFRCCDAWAERKCEMWRKKNREISDGNEAEKKS